MELLYRLIESKTATSAESKFIRRTLVRGRVTESGVVEKIRWG
jgi:hypothetical protein